MWFYFLAGAGAGSLRNRKSQLGVCDVVIPSRAGVAASKCVEVAITQVSLALNTPSVFLSGNHPRVCLEESSAASRNGSGTANESLA